MKLQNLAVIFVLIILPISIILGVYIDNQVETLRLQNSYDTKLNNATYDALKAFQLNTINNSTSDLPDSKARDIEASVNSFFNSIASNFNMHGYNRDILKEYVPALVYTMYDGYYIYSRYTNTLTSDDYAEEDAANGIKASTYQDGEKLSGLKSYVFYSCRYIPNPNSDFVITYSLDNYITIKGIINDKPVDDAGYLINDCEGNNNNYAEYREIPIRVETLQEYLTEDTPYTYVKINGVKYYKEGGQWFSLLNNQKLPAINLKENNNSAVRYYSEAEEFRKKILGTTSNITERYNLQDLKTSDAVFEDGKKYNENGQTLAQKMEWRRL